MEIIRAEHSGFCFGVDRAINLAFSEAEKRRNNLAFSEAEKRRNNLAFSEAEKRRSEPALCGTDEHNDLHEHGHEGRLLTCGYLIHNKDVVKKLESYGVGMISSLDEAEEGDTVIVRSHGEPKEFYVNAESMGVRLIDTTCVFVKKIHDIVEAAHAAGRPVIVVGDRNHQEVTATNGWCGYTAVIIESADEARQYAASLHDHATAGLEDGTTDVSPVRTDRNRGCVPVVVCQTTIKAELLREILDVFDENGIEYEIRNTICNATRDRQESCRVLSGQVDLMVVIGDTHSSNSRKLYEIAKKTAKTAFL